MIKVMNLLYKFRGTINSTSSLRMPKPALITKKSGSIWIERTEKMEDLADIDESEKVDPIWIFGYRFHEKGDEEADNGVIFLERIGSDDDEEEVEKDKDEKENPKKKIHQLAPIESITISSFHEFAKCTLWFSYRSEFVPIQGPKKIKSDAGWGCMIRTAQMMIAEGLIRHAFGDSWKLGKKPLDRPEVRTQLQRVISFFGDNDSFPLSLHNIVYTGSRKYGKKPGEWFGPATVSCTIRDLIVANTEKLGITAYTADNGLIDVKAILKLFRDRQLKMQSKESSSKSESDQFFRIDDPAKAKPAAQKETISLDDVEWAPLIILIPIKVGMETVHPMYIPSLESLFMIPQSIGVVGGKPYSSFYFIAGQGDVLHFLDPHYVQDYVPIPPDKVSFEISTWTDPEIRWIKAINVDATFSAGFFIRNKADFIRFETISKFIFTKVQPLFSFEHGLVSKESLLNCSSSNLSSSASSTTHNRPHQAHSHEANTTRRAVNLEAKANEPGEGQRKEEPKGKTTTKDKEDLTLPKPSQPSLNSSTHIAVGQPTLEADTRNFKIIDEDDDDDFEIIM